MSAHGKRVRVGPLSLLSRVGRNRYVAKVYRRTPQGLELRCEAIGPDHYARAALDRADLLMTDAGKDEVQHFFNNYDANRIREQVKS
jgi:hypothetical protein